MWRTGLTFFASCVLSFPLDNCAQVKPVILDTAPTITAALVPLRPVLTNGTHLEAARNQRAALLLLGPVAAYSVSMHAIVDIESCIVIRVLGGWEQQQQQHPIVWRQAESGLVFSTSLCLVFYHLTCRVAQQS